jgi:hypothetical protein
MNKYIYVEDSFEESRLNLRQSLFILGEDVIFEKNTWICNRKKKGEHNKRKHYTIYFNKIPKYYVELVKYYVIVRAKNRKAISTISKDVTHVSKFLKFIVEEYGEISLVNLNNIITNQFKLHLDSLYKNEQTKYSAWESVRAFFKTLNGWTEIPNINPLRLNPFQKVSNFDKLIPEDIATKLDIVFLDKRIPLYQRLMYWILRLIPSRVNAVCGMEIDCLKPFNGHYVIFIPNNKEDDGYKEHSIRSIHIEYDDIGKHLIDLIREQQIVANQLQINEENGNLLFKYRVASFDGNR